MTQDKTISAFPQTVGDTHCFGRTLRDYCAAKAMQAYLTRAGADDFLDSTARYAYDVADAMLVARKAVN